ncbi:hypothetical protein A3A67_03600 [Candidatus Peribacteria bacterium RIFCSPLOWO2_01_FULL_51_18]|nr:MAG: hypothetical protein A3A67_03600 [Candidatus Peribacteria bacterium RIFCSPLOWO2_01_FULL_51_18]
MSSFSFLKKTRIGFSLVEMGVVVGVGAVAAGIAVPVFMNYRYSSDLHVAVANITQGIGEAKILAQSSKNDSAWGFSVTNGVVFQGESYATRQAGSDEFFPVPPTVAASGLLELFFTKMDGTVSRTGVILLMAKNGNKIAITIDNFGIATAGEATSSAIAMAGSDYSSVASAGGGDSSAQSGLSVSSTSAGGGDGSEGAGSSLTGSVESSGGSAGVSSSASTGTGGSEPASAGSSEAVASSSSAANPPPPPPPPPPPESSSVASLTGSGSTGSLASSAFSSSSSSVEPPIVWVSSNVGVLLLDPAMEGSLNISGNGNVLNISNNQGVVAVNSNHAKAAKLSGNGDATAYEFRITGVPGTYASGNGEFVGTITSGAAPTPDPLLSVVTPTPPTQTYSAVNISGGTQATINPGTYVGGITVSSNAKLTMNPGIYYLQGGGLKISSNATVTGNGVMIYNAPDAASDTITISGNGNVTLTAMTSGIYAGMAVFQRRPSPVPLLISGNGVLNVNGIVYLPGAPLTVTGNGDLLGVFVNLQCVANSRFIFRSMSFTGNGEFNVQ